MISRLERARGFLLGRYKSTALRVLPLALLAMGAAQAATVTVTVTGPTGVIGSFGSGGGLSSSVIMGVNGTGVKFFGDVDADCSGPSSTCIVQFDFNVSNSAGPTVQLDFVILFQSLAGAIDWDVSDGASGLYAFGATSGFQPFITDSVVVNNGTVRFRFESEFVGDGFRVFIPGDSIDFTPAAAVPEPGTMALALAGAAALALARRRRK